MDGNCGESEECVPLRFCTALKGEGRGGGELKKLNRDKFCGSAGFLRYCCPSEMKTDSSENQPKESILQSFKITEVESEYQSYDPKTNTTSVEFVEGESLSPENQEKCDEGETCKPLRFCSCEGKLSRTKFCGPLGFHHYCC